VDDLAERLYGRCADAQGGAVVADEMRKARFDRSVALTECIVCCVADLGSI
jgi:hypothetical protein